MLNGEPREAGEYPAVSAPQENSKSCGAQNVRRRYSQGQPFEEPLNWAQDISTPVPNETGPSLHLSRRQAWGDPTYWLEGEGGVLASFPCSLREVAGEGLAAPASLVPPDQPASVQQVSVEQARAADPDLPRALSEVIEQLSADEISLLTFLKAFQQDEPWPEEQFLREYIRRAIVTENQLRGRFRQPQIAETFERMALAYLTGWGPFEYFRRLQGVTKLMINGRQATFIEQEGTCRYWGKGLPASRLNDLIEALTGQRLSSYQPVLHVPLPDGSWLNATDVSVGLDMTVTICRSPAVTYPAEELVALGMVSQPCLELLGVLLRARVNIILAGEQGSGKTTLAAALANRLPPAARVVVLEEALPELHVSLPNVVHLLSPVVSAHPLRSPLFKPVILADLLSNALHQAPDHIIVGECRGGEALALLEAMHRSQVGWLTTLHAHSTLHALFRLETLALQGETHPTSEAIQHLIASTVQIVAYLGRTQHGLRVRQVDAVVPNHETPGGHSYRLLPLFCTEQVQGETVLQRTSAPLPEELVNCLLHAGIGTTPYLERVQGRDGCVDAWMDT